MTGPVHHKHENHQSLPSDSISGKLAAGFKQFKRGVGVRMLAAGTALYGVSRITGAAGGILAGISMQAEDPEILKQQTMTNLQGHISLLKESIATQKSLMDANTLWNNPSIAGLSTFAHARNEFVRLQQDLARLEKDLARMPTMDFSDFVESYDYTHVVTALALSTCALFILGYGLRRAGSALIDPEKTK